MRTKYLIQYNTQVPFCQDCVIKQKRKFEEKDQEEEQEEKERMWAELAEMVHREGRFETTHAERR